MKKKLDNKLIEALPVCEDGKKAISLLLEGMGYEINNRFTPGNIWKGTKSNTIYMILSDKQIMAISKGKFTRFLPMGQYNMDIYYLYDSLKEFLDDGGEL